MNTNVKNKRSITSASALALVLALLLTLVTLAPGAAFANGTDVRETIDSQMTITLQKASYTPDSASNTSSATYNTNTATNEATTQAAATNQNANTNQTSSQTSSSTSTGDAIPFAVLGLLALAAGAVYCLRESKKLPARRGAHSNAQSRGSNFSAQSRKSSAGAKLSAARTSSARTAQSRAARAARTSSARIARATNARTDAASRKKMLTVAIAVALIFATCFGAFTCKTLAIAQTVGQKITSISEVTINEAGEVLSTKITITNDSTKTVSIEKIVPPGDLSAWSCDFGGETQIAPGEKIEGTWTGKTVTTDYVTQAGTAEDNTFTISTLKTVVKYDNEVTTDAKGIATTLEPDGTDNCSEFNFVLTDEEEDPIPGATVSIDANAKTTVTLPEGFAGKIVKLKMTDAKGEAVTGKKVEVIESSGTSRGETTTTDGSAIWRVLDASNATVEDVTYTGAALTPKVTIPGFTEGTDFEIVEWENNIDAGQASVKVKGIGTCTGTATINFTIAPYDISNSSLSFANSGTAYTGSVIEAGTATVTLDVPLASGTKTITQETDFTISSESTLSGTNAGTYNAEVEGTGNFIGTLSGTWTIAQADLPDSDIAALKTAIGTPEVYVGTKLSSVTLPTLTGGTLAWSSEYTSVETVGDVATTVQRNAIYTPKDTNYKPATITVNINVKKTYTVVYHSNGGTLEGATFDAVNDEYTYSEEIDLDNTTSALTANKFTNEGNTFAYWTLGKSDTNVVADNATNTTLTYVDGHSLADGNGMYTNTSTSSSKTKVAVGATLDLYAHWADDSIGDYWMAAAAATLPDASTGIVMTQTQVATEIASSGTTGASATLKGYMDSDTTGGNPGTGTHLYTRWNEDKALPMADRYTEFRIVQVGEHLNITDDTTSGDGSNVTFMAVHSLPTAQQANANNTNVGGWGSSDLRGLMDTYVAANMPSDFTSALKTVTKKAYSGSNDNWISDSTTNDKIWLMSYSELTGATRKTAGFEGTQYAWFSSKVTNLDLDGTNAAIANLHKTRSGLSPESLYYERVWMRSPELSMWGRFWAVYWDGNPNWCWYPANSLSVCIALCM